MWNDLLKIYGEELETYSLTVFMNKKKKRKKGFEKKKTNSWGRGEQSV